MSGPTPNPLVHKYKNKKTHKVKLTLKKKKTKSYYKAQKLCFSGAPNPSNKKLAWGVSRCRWWPKPSLPAPIAGLQCPIKP